MQPIDPRTGTEKPPLPPRGTRASTNPGDGTLVTLNQTSRSATNAEVGIWDQFTTQLSLIFRNLFPEQPSLLVLSDDALCRFFANITDDKDLVRITVTCITLYGMRTYSEIQCRIPRIMTTPVFGMQFDQKGTELILAANRRPSTPSESSNTELNVKQLEKEFYCLFKKRCAQINFNSSSGYFLMYVSTAIDNINKKIISLNIVSDCMNIKIETITNRFCNKIFHDIVEAYANQPSDMITPDSFRKKVAELKGLFPMNSIANIEAALRRAIRTPTHIAEMKILADEYLDPTSHKVELKEALKTEFEHCKQEIEIANNTMFCAQAGFDSALAAAQQAMGAPRGMGPSADTILCLGEIACAPPSFIAAQVDLRTKDAVLKAAKGAVADKMGELTRGTGINITRGGIHELEAKFAEQFDTIVQKEAAKLAEFYAELSLEVLPGQEATRSAALHNIIG